MLVLTANIRTYHKKNATRRLRKRNKFPAIVYGCNHKNLTIELSQHIIQHPNIFTQIYKNNIILLHIEEQQTSITTKIQAIQYHPVKAKITHIDFLRILHKN